MAGITSLDPYDYTNWLKAWHIVFATRHGLKGLTEKVVEILCENAFSECIRGHTINDSGRCEQCRCEENENLSCHEKIVQYVKGCYRNYDPTKELEQFDNINIKQWEKPCWTIAVCFMPVSYKERSSDFSKTDINGVFNFIRTCTLFERFVDLTVCEEVSIIFLLKIDT